MAILDLISRVHLPSFVNKKHDYVNLNIDIKILKTYVFEIHAKNTKLRKEFGLGEFFDKLKRGILNNVWKTQHLIKIFKLILLSQYQLSVLPQIYLTDKNYIISKRGTLIMNIISLLKYFML